MQGVKGGARMVAELLLDDTDVKIFSDSSGEKREVLLSYEKYLAMMSLAKQYVRLCARIQQQFQQATEDLPAQMENILADAQGEETDWLAMSLATFQQGWDNEEDAIYDQWRELYGVATR